MLSLQVGLSPASQENLPCRGKPHNLPLQPRTLHTRQEGVPGWGAGVSSPLVEELTRLTALPCSSGLCLVTVERGKRRRGNGFCHPPLATATQSGVTPVPPALGMRWGEKGSGDPRHSTPGGG